MSGYLESKKIILGVKWASIQYALNTVFRFGVKLVLAKLLVPEEFGLVGMSVIFIALATVISEMGIGAALIQKKEDSDAKALYSTAYWTGLIWGGGLYLLMSFLVAPLAAYFFKEPILKTLIPALSLIILLKPLVMIHTIILSRDLNFKKIAKISNLTSLLAGILAILSAYFGFGVWSLVINSVFATILSLPFYFKAIKWIPSLEWKQEHFKEFFGFGAYSTITGVFGTLTYNIDNLMIGKLLGASLLGSYSLSFSLTEQMRQMVSNVLNKVMYPVYGKNQNNKVKLKRYYIKTLNINSLLIYPLMSFFLIYADTIILGFFGDEWKEAIMPLRILSLAMMVHLLVNSFTSLIRGLGKPRLEMTIIGCLTIFVLVPSLYYGIVNYGLKGAAWAILFNKIALVSIGVYVLKREVGLGFVEILKAIKNAILGVSGAIMLVLLFEIAFGIENFFILFSLYCLTYGFITYKLEKQNLEAITKQFFK